MDLSTKADTNLYIWRMLDDASIASWDWNLDGQHSTYHAVFPRAWTIYDGKSWFLCKKSGSNILGEQAN